MKRFVTKLLILCVFVTKLSSFDIGIFMFPLPKEYDVPSRITSPQGMRKAIEGRDTGGQEAVSSYHNAIDIAVPDKTPVYASKSGYAVDVWPSIDNGPYEYKGHPTYGGMILLEHPDGTSTLYAHLSKTEIKEGEWVNQGDLIGKTGGIKGRRGSGTSTGPHLHFSIFINLDIVKFLHKGDLYGN